MGKANPTTFESGRVKTGGRVAGTPNKRTFDAIAKVEALKACPITKLVELMSSSEDAIALGAAKELASYLYPKRKALEVDMSGGSEIASEAAKATMDLLTQVLTAAKSERKPVK